MSWDLRRCDAFDLLRSLPDQSVDATVTDPPYGTTANAWDVAPDWPALMAELLRVTRGAVCVFSQMPAAADVMGAARDRFRYQLVWRKGNPTGFLDAGRRPLRAHELVLVFCRKGYGEYHPQKVAGEPYVHVQGPYRAPCYNKCAGTTTVNDGWHHPTDVLDFDAPHAGRHPTEKPVDLVRWLVRTYTSPGATVLDPYAGSGSLGEACALEGRSFIGSELDGTYHAAACERVRLAYAQGTLFDPWEVAS